MLQTSAVVASNDDLPQLILQNSPTLRYSVDAFRSLGCPQCEGRTGTLIRYQDAEGWKCQCGKEICFSGSWIEKLKQDRSMWTNWNWLYDRIHYYWFKKQFLAALKWLKFR